ncbi:SpoIIE family protein phosphatase [Agathobaculum sp.]|uniref:SpoIIE family protein phosphatase n=1 Tax=Agathobaculum sp. TaxID=2048138 RepID=UPI002A7EA6D5|nr:SpoIIE family protein phosphatase [Agathobaculum sp.]MDY3618185.1 SpoIIE family protein phosphatase [Agathobaculum sp.]
MDKQKTKRTAPQAVGWAAARLAQAMNEERLHFVLRGVERFALCAVLARGTVLGGYAPFGLAMAAALMVRGAGLSAIGGVFFGAMLLQGGTRSAVYAAAALLVLCVVNVCGGLKIVKRAWFAPVIAALSGAACTFVFLPVGQALTIPVLMTFAAAQALTFAACMVYGIALSPPREQNDWRRPATLLALAATVLLSLSDLEIFSLIAPARIAGLLIVLAAAYLGGSTTGAAAGVAFGAAMDLAAGQGALFTCGFGLCALVSGLFREHGRAWFALTALGAGLCAALLGADNVLFVPLILETVCAVALFAAMPPFVWSALRQTLLPDTLMGEAAGLRVRQSAGKCASEVAQAFYELYLAMLTGASAGRAAGDQNVRVVFDKASDRVCKNCVLCSQCWQRDYVTTLSALNDVTQPMLKRGRAELSDFPYHFASRCVHLPELMRAINSALFALRERQSARRQEEEHQNLLARQYAGITDILRQIGAEATQDYTAQPLREQQVRRYAAAFGWIERVAVFRDGGGRMVVELFGEGIDDVLKQGAGFTAGLSALIGVGLAAPQKVEDELGARLVLRERAPYRVIVGAGRQQKEGSSVSGDSGCYFLTDAGVACLLLADGMGTGAAAAQDSRTLLSSMERFLRAGITPTDALKAVSPAFRLRSDGTRFVTLDVLTLDLFTGRAESLKCGAAPTYFRAGGTWSRLDCKTLPIGLAEQDEQADAVPLRLGHGDLYVMLSDGVCDGTDDGWVIETLQNHAGESPKELAARLVQEARGRGADDDRTALVLRVEKS